MILSRNLISRTFNKCPKSTIFNTKRFFADDTHDDFKPKLQSIPTGLDEVKALIHSQVNDNEIMLYMKGTPAQPQCGFSMQAVRILNALGADFQSVNVLEFAAIREGIKEYSDWPTIPQLYVKGEFVGGCDIMTSMFQEGELEKHLIDNGIKLE